ncbi:MAG: IS3 family transposase [Planctomycetota bacterium]
MIGLVQSALKKGVRKETACQLYGIALRTLQRWEKLSEQADQRKGPNFSPNQLSEEERSQIIKMVNSREYVDLAPSQIVPKLADEGRYIGSESTIYRVMREEKLLTHRRKSAPPKRREPGRAVARRANEIWSWDITYLRGPILGMYFYLYLMVDIFSRKIVGWEVHVEENSELSSLLVEETLQKENAIGQVKLVHSDNGAPMKGATMLATLQRLGVMPSFSRPSVSNDNAYSESLFKTLKYMPEYPAGGFKSRESAQEWVRKFVEWYNTQHLHSGIRYVTPESRHNGEEESILEHRHEVYEEAKKKHPNRWSGETRNWERIEVVYLNPVKTEEKESVA